MIIGRQLQDITRMLHLSVWGCFLHLVGHEAEIRMELFSKLFPGSDFGKFLPFLTHTVLNPQAHVLIEEGRVGIHLLMELQESFHLLSHQCI